MAKKKDTENKKAHLNYKKGLKLGLIVAASLLALFLITFAIYSVSYGKKVYAKVYIGELNLGGKNKAEVSNSLTAESDKYLKDNIILKHTPEAGDAKSYTLAPSEIGLVYDVVKSADAVMRVGRNGQIGSELWQQLKSLFIKQKVEMVYSVNQEALDAKILSIANEVDTPEKDFSIKYDGSGKFVLTTERTTGKRISQENILASISKNISTLHIVEVSFKSEIFEPKVNQAKAEKALEKANAILSEGDLEIVTADKKTVWTVDTLASVLKSETKKDDLLIIIDNEKLKQQIATIATGLDAVSKNAVFKYDGSKVVAFQSSESGKKLDQDKALVDLSAKILGRAKPGSVQSITLLVLTTKPEIDSAEIAKYGLNEIVATGTTSFAGSPANRIHNIQVGLNSINGTLLKPGEEFSTLKRLGTIDGSTGYLPELVIKNGKTIPEFGGGLCQVSTTLFRSALNAGMEITERNNHAYRVSYYEPPIGMDATIYDPAPDFKFINNYNSYILVQGRIEGTKITFEFYGTKDTRTTEIGVPVAFDYVAPPAPEETPTDTLPAGTRQQLAKAHQGASAKFHYKVTRDGVILQEKDFLSKYVAMAEKWLVGTAPVAAPAPASDPTPVANTEDPAVTPAG